MAKGFCRKTSRKARHAISPNLSHVQRRTLRFETLEDRRMLAADFSEENLLAGQADGPWSVYAADVDSDGDLDVLSASIYDDKIAWYESDGNENFTTHVITTGADGADSVFAADVDSDGDLDVLSASVNDDKIAWYENDGNENFTTHVITTGANGAQSVFAADVDSDGDLDVLSASANDDKIAWYENLNNSFDFDSDGNVDGTDLGLWQAGYGTTSGAKRSDGDADRDGDVDGHDFLAWQRGFRPAPLVVAATAPSVNTLDLPATSPPLSTELVDLALTVELRFKANSTSRSTQPTLGEDFLDWSTMAPGWTPTPSWHNTGETEIDLSLSEEDLLYITADDDAISEEILDALFADEEFHSLL